MTTTLEVVNMKDLGIGARDYEGWIGTSQSNGSWINAGSEGVESWIGASSSDGWWIGTTMNVKSYIQNYDMVKPRNFVYVSEAYMMKYDMMIFLAMLGVVAISLRMTWRRHRWRMSRRLACNANSHLSLAREFKSLKTKRRWNGTLKSRWS